MCLHVALHVHLALLALRRRGQRHDAEHARAHALGDRLDRPALAGGVAAFEDDADLQALRHDPLLQLDELDVQALELLLVFLPAHALGCGGGALVSHVARSPWPCARSRRRAGPPVCRAAWSSGWRATNFDASRASSSASRRKSISESLSTPPASTCCLISIARGSRNLTSRSISACTVPASSGGSDMAASHACGKAYSAPAVRRRVHADITRERRAVRCLAARFT